MNDENEVLNDDVVALYKKLTIALQSIKLGVAGRIVYFSKELKMFILAVHSTSPDDTERAGNIALDAIRDTVYLEILEAGFGFACKQI